MKIVTQRMRVRILLDIDTWTVIDLTIRVVSVPCSRMLSDKTGKAEAGPIASAEI
jgi:hypothetical protein